jgi:REP element-mobilizing transposase RayT
VTPCDNQREMIFESNDDRRAFLSVFDEVCETFNWGCHAYCLMRKHYRFFD